MFDIIMSTKSVFLKFLFWEVWAGEDAARQPPSPPMGMALMIIMEQKYAYKTCTTIPSKRDLGADCMIILKY
jgi:hypothetical protein